MTLAVVIPTVAGREEELRQVIDEYAATAPGCHVLVQTGHDAVAKGWNAGVEAALHRNQHPEQAKARGRSGELYPAYDVVLLTNDDVHPQAGWYEAMMASLEAGETPVPVCWRPDATIESGGVFGRAMPEGSEVEWTPLCAFYLSEWERFGPLPPIHYWSDNAFAAASMYALRRPLVVRHAFRFIHTWSMPGRLTMEERRAKGDEAAFQAYRDELITRWASA